MSAHHLLSRLRVSGRDSGPLFAALERVTQGSGTPLPILTSPPAAARAAHRTAHPQTAQVTHRLEAAALSTTEATVQAMTACLNDAPCREITRAIFRALYAVALDVAATLGHAAGVGQVVFHLPAELLMHHVGRRKSAFYENLRYLRGAGLIHCEAHMGDLRGQSVATGTLWAVSLQPGRVLTGQAARARIRRGDWAFPWRDLNADARAGRTVYNALHPYAKAAAGQSRDARQGKTPLKELQDWATKPFLNFKPDTLTVRPVPAAARSVVYELGEAAAQPSHRRSAVIDRQARALAQAFGDRRPGFWRRLIWNLTRGIDAGVDLTRDAGVILSRVLADLRHDLSAGSAPPHTPAAVANRALSDIRAHLELFKDNRVGSRPAA